MSSAAGKDLSFWFLQAVSIADIFNILEVFILMKKISFPALFLSEE